MINWNPLYCFDARENPGGFIPIHVLYRGKLYRMAWAPFDEDHSEWGWLLELPCGVRHSFAIGASEYDQPLSAPEGYNLDVPWHILRHAWSSGGTFISDDTGQAPHPTMGMWWANYERHESWAACSGTFNTADSDVPPTF